MKKSNKQWLLEYLDFLLDDDIDFFYIQDKENELLDLKIFLKQHDEEFYKKFFGM